ncbi:MAG: hypothetical protein M0008_14025 [Actinomycetota bacterium]|nr:hypothetical protein [Actinomycetota bacterium]
MQSAPFSWDRGEERSDVVLAWVVLRFPLRMYPVDRLVPKTCGKVVSVVGSPVASTRERAGTMAVRTTSRLAGRLLVLRGYV